MLDEAREIIKRNAEKITCLEVFFQETEELLRLVLPGINRQLCESLHARKAKMACKDISWKASWRARMAAATLDINEPDWRMTLSYRLPLPKLHPMPETVIHRHEAQVMKRTAKAQLVGAVKKCNTLRQHRRKASERDEQINLLYKCIQKERIIKRDNVLTHRKLDGIIRHSFPLGLEEEDRTDDEESDFSDDDIKGSNLSDPGQTKDGLSLDSESSSDEEQWDIARADLEHRITHLWDAMQDMTNIDDVRFILSNGAKFETVDLTLARDLPTG
jgi:hypothetical protein